MEKKQNVPALRFQGFSGEWERETLFDILDINSGQDYKSLGIGAIPVYGTGGYMLSVDKALSYKKDAIGIGRKGTIDKPFILKAPFWTVDTLFFAIPKEKYDLDFILGIFKNIDWKGKDESTGVPSLSKVAIGRTITYTPSFREQQKIGSLLEKLNEREQLIQSRIQKLQQFRQAMLMKLFPREGAAEPELRFRGFSDPWNRHLLNYYLEPSKEKNSQHFFTKKDVLSVSGEVGIVNQIKLQGRSFAGASVANYGIVYTGDVVYTKSPLNANPYGIIKANKGCNGIVSTLYAVYHTKETAEPNFIECYFDVNARLNQYLKPLVNKGAKNDMKVTAANALLGMVVFPHRDEQKKIADFFERLNSFISFQQKKLERMQRLKGALLEKMFV